ncbi:hypothetical protein DAETH_09110 [Deinococcus aetherius]|uniref:DUF4097 domain-containing protein n=1 Tax=Deinococcus aetherius TaxID=200252 RepID=A0ABN6RH42_9DEIO|nr:DUF4097 domain-containing protein [Deinococcus aetherius]BDP40942.1 hypothetical protein DAETH_09110 [Deinococcus aetherius]
MTIARRPPDRPLPPVLARIALGLALVAGGVGLGWQGAQVTPTPGLSTVRTPLRVPLAGANSLNVRLEGDRTTLLVGGLAWPERAALVGTATRRERNPVELATIRQEGTLHTNLRLNVRPLNEGVIRGGTTPLQHKLDVGLTRGVPVTLSTDSYSGDARLDLHALRLRALSVRSSFGDVTATLPGRQSGPLTFVTLGGDVDLRARPEWRSPALRVNTESGDVRLALGSARTEALNLGTRSGDVTGELPRVDRLSVTTGSGDVDLNLPDGAAGTFDFRSEGGRMTLVVPRDLSTRVRFTDRNTVELPEGWLRQGNTAASTSRALDAPDLDLFIDARVSDLATRDPGTSPEGDPTP